MSENAEVDIWSMSDEDFLKLNMDEVTTDAEEAQEDDEVSTDTSISTDADDADDEDEQQEEQAEGDDNDDEQGADTQQPTQAEIDYKAEYERLLATTVKSNGKEIKLDSVDELVELAQAGVAAGKNKPNQKIIAMLEKAQLLDEEKLNHAIDLMNKNPKAIQALIKGMDVNELLDEPEEAYVPTNHRVSDTQLNLDAALDRVQATPTGARTIGILGSQWDESSRVMVAENPEIIAAINDHVATGVYDKVSAVMEKQKLLGKIPVGMNDLQAYKMIGDQMHQQGLLGGGTTTSAPKPANPIIKPARQNVAQQRKAAAGNVGRGNTQSQRPVQNVFAMSDADFLKLKSQM